MIVLFYCRQCIPHTTTTNNNNDNNNNNSNKNNNLAINRILRHKSSPCK